MSKENMENMNSLSSPPTVSVVIPVYNVEEWLRETLDTVAAQTFQDWECVCVDDGSRDASADIVREYEQRDPRFRLVSQSNAGAAAARNHGLEEARGEFLIFVDSDDLIAPDMLQCCVERMRADGSDICAFHIDAFGTAEHQLGKVFIRVDIPEGEESFCFEPRLWEGKVFSVVQPAACNKLYRTAFLRQHDLKFPLGLKRSEDTSMGVLAIALAQRVSCLDKILYHYRQSRPNSQMQSLSGKDVQFCYHDAALEIWNKMRHYGILKTFGMQAIYVSLANAAYYYGFIDSEYVIWRGRCRMHRYVKNGVAELKRLGAEPTAEQLAHVEEIWSWSARVRPWRVCRDMLKCIFTHK